VWPIGCPETSRKEITTTRCVIILKSAVLKKKIFNIHDRAGESFWGACPNCPQTSKKSFRVLRWILKSKLRSWSPTQIIINYWIILNTRCNYIISAQYNYISNKGLLDETDKEENLWKAGAAATSCLKKKYCETFCTISRIRLDTVRLAPQWHISVNTLHCSRIV
jgi:hypothetical protein